MARNDSRPFLKDIAIPTLVLSGDQDLLISNAYSREMAEAIPGAALEIVPQCGQMAQPEAVIAAIGRWLKR